MDVHQDRSGTDAPAAAVPPPAISPGLASKTLGAAFELKFQLSASEADRILDWARGNLSPDRNGDNGRYRVTSLYTDTPVLDVFRRTKGFKRTKFRLRRYGDMSHVFLERKTKRNDQVQKRRSQVAPDDLAYLVAHPESAPPAEWAGEWFLRRVRQRGLRPTCCVTYQRAAFFGMAGDAPIRMTLDRDVTGIPAADWAVPDVTTGQALLPGTVLLEMKFHLHLPPLFRELLSLLPGQASKASKYRRCVTECGLWDGSTGDLATTAGHPLISTVTLASGISLATAVLPIGDAATDAPPAGGLVDAWPAPAMADVAALSDPAMTHAPVAAPAVPLALTPDALRETI